MMKFWIVEKFFPMDVAVSRRSHEHSPNYWMLFSGICNVRHSFCPLRTWSFTLFTNSAATLPMTKFSESATSWALALSGCHDPYLTDCASPSRRVSVSMMTTNLLYHTPGSFIRFPWSIVCRNLIFPLLRRPSTVIIQFWITCWGEFIRFWTVSQKFCHP